MRLLVAAGRTTPVQRHERGQYRHVHTKIYRPGQVAVNAVTTTLIGWWPHDATGPGSRYEWWNDPPPVPLHKRRDYFTVEEQTLERESYHQTRRFVL